MEVRIFLFFTSLFLLSSCYENIEGCLDVNATNFEVTADRKCDECCTYPSLKLSVQHRFSSPDSDTTLVPFKLDGFNTLDSTDYFSISKLRYYISDLKLVREDNTKVGVEEQLEVAFIQPSGDTLYRIVDNNFALINPSDISSRTIGTFRENGKFVALEFYVGLPEDVRNVAPQFFDSDSPLAFSDSMLYDFGERQYIVTQLELSRDTTFFTGTDTVQVNIFAKDFYEPVSLELPFTIDVGFNTLIALQVDYKKWLDDIDVKNDTETQIALKLQENIATSFKLVGVRATN